MKRSFGTIIYFISIMALLSMIFANKEDFEKRVSENGTFIK